VFSVFFKSRHIVRGERLGRYQKFVITGFFVGLRRMPNDTTEKLKITWKCG